MSDTIFVTGWAGYADLFPNLAARSEFLLPFIHQTEREVFDRLDSTTASTLVAWSTGAHMVLKRWTRVAPKFDRIVLVAPFLCFTDHVREKLVRHMIRDLRRDDEAVVRAFLRNCGYNGNYRYDRSHLDGLFTGLEYLRASRAMPSNLHAEKVTILHGEHDRIVPPVASEDIWEIMRGATFVALPHGHWIPEDELETFLA
ncbi:alpha/beta fold hydrolase [Pseudodesulfovibrio tunisiensis]|uniref:alpha/beta fold hydrolase n=1 Tax=Pseudodesulfovibrio tunisiensis TaxID=463192 RepID=UPI001FB1E1CC|nr:alpha/beta hydrolase [Pseudodesulfovibrio tunisiensis]